MTDIVCVSFADPDMTKLNNVQWHDHAQPLNKYMNLYEIHTTEIIRLCIVIYLFYRYVFVPVILQHV